MYKIAVIDDEYMVIEGFKAIIKRCGTDCEIAGTAENGRDAMAMLRAVKPDIVFTDIRMPGMDGLELIEQTLDEFPETDFVIISGYAEFSYARRAIVLGVRDYLEKPITIEKVKEVLSRLIGEREQMKSLAEEQSDPNLAEQESVGLHRSVEIATRYMKEHYRENISLNDMAREAGVTSAYLSSLFKKEVGMSPVKYLTHFRMEKAKKLLKEGYKVADVSAHVGYQDYRYFCEVFKKQEGRTPNEYRGYAARERKKERTEESTDVEDHGIF